MTDSFTPVVRVVVVAALLLATATLMLVAVKTARAGSARTIGTPGSVSLADRQAYDTPPSTLTY